MAPAHGRAGPQLAPDGSHLLRHRPDSSADALGQRCVDRRGIAVGVEQPSRALGRRGEVTGIGQGERAHHLPLRAVGTERDPDDTEVLVSLLPESVALVSSSLLPHAVAVRARTTVAMPGTIARRMVLVTEKAPVVSEDDSTTLERSGVRLRGPR